MLFPGVRQHARTAVNHESISRLSCGELRMATSCIHFILCQKLYVTLSLFGHRMRVAVTLCNFDMVLHCFHARKLSKIMLFFAGIARKKKKEKSFSSCDPGAQPEFQISKVNEMQPYFASPFFSLPFRETPSNGKDNIV